MTTNPPCILTTKDEYSYSPACPLHTGGTSKLSDTGSNDFVYIDGSLIVPINTNHPSSCCTLTITGPESFVTIKGTSVSLDGASYSMPCHTAEVVPSCQNTWVCVKNQAGL